MFIYIDMLFYCSTWVLSCSIFNMILLIVNFSHHIVLSILNWLPEFIASFILHSIFQYSNVLHVLLVSPLTQESHVMRILMSVCLHLV